jgi:hypothetical protein
MANGNGAVSTYAYRTDNRPLLEVTATLPSGYTFHDLNFTYDKVGNILSQQNAAQPPAKNSIGRPESKTFVYDDLYQLLSSTGTHTIARRGRRIRTASAKRTTRSTT